VCEVLTRHPYLDATEIEVIVTNGEITLRGTVESRPMKRLAEACAEAVPGVTEVDNRLRVVSGQEAG
jgi:osmotically-inducible protein OsmY